MVSVATDLRDLGWEVSGLFEQTIRTDPAFEAAFTNLCTAPREDIAPLITKYKASGVSIVFIHKCSYPEWIKEFGAHFKTVVMVHDHDYYCLRRHKYFPLRRINCHLRFNPGYCALCSMLLEKREGKPALIDLSGRIKLLNSLKQCDRFLVLSEFMKHNLISNGFNADKINLLIPHQTPKAISGVPSGEIPVMLYMGQLIRGKGVDLLLKAFCELRNPALLRIVGRGNDQEYLRNLSEHLGLAHKVEFLDWTEEPGEEYVNADIVVVPSRWQEPYGLIGVEAFAHAKPVVAFDVGGITQWLKHGQNGLLVRAGDTQRLAKALDKLLASADLRQQYGMAGYEMVKQSHHKEAYLRTLTEPLDRLLELP